MQDFMLSGFRLGNSTNDGQVMDLIRRQGPISKAEIAKLTGLTPPTVTNITNRLLDSDLIMEYMIGESSGGRRPLLLKINKNIGQVIIVNIGSQEITVYLVDPEFQIEYEDNKSIKGLQKEEILELMLTMIVKCQEVTDVQVLAVGVVVRGPVRSQEGVSVFAPNIGWRNVPLKYIIEEKTRLPAFIENDSRTLANGEYYYGLGKDAGSMVLLKVSHGIGSGIMFNGKLYRGVNDSAGEIGHTTIDVDGPVCSCGNYGCMEAMASEDALVGMVIKAIKEGQISLVHKLVNGDLANVTPNEIYRAADEQDDVSIRMLSRVARYLGIGIANLVNIFNPQLVVIGGGIAKARRYIEDIVWQTVRDRSFESCSSVLEIRFSTAETENTMKGAADMIFAEITEPIWLGQR